MADYKAIKGKPVLNIASDLDNAEGEGEIWFNTTSSDYKTIVKVAGAWATGGTLNLAREEIGGSGATQSAAIAFGGLLAPPGSPRWRGETEIYDGSAWTESGDLVVGRSLVGGAGTTTACLAFGGGNPGPPFDALTEEYDGSSWTEVADLSTARQALAGYGTSTSANAVGGEAYVDVYEQWNGTAWTEVADLNTARQKLVGCGTTTAGLVFAGQTPPFTGSALTEIWDGSSWTEVGDLNTARSKAAGSGITTAAMLIGGSPAPPGNTDSVELYDGTSWTEVADMATARRNTAAATGAPISSSIIFGGFTATAVSAATEEWNFTSTLAAGAWASGGNLNTARSQGAGIGTQTAALCAGGNTPPYTADSETYDGSSWTEGGNLQSARRNAEGTGLTTAGMIVGGVDDAVNDETELYDGSTWTVSPVSLSRGGGTNGMGISGASQTSALVFGGEPGNTYRQYSETWNGSAWTEGNDLNSARSEAVGTGTATAALCIGGYPLINNVESYDGSSWTETSTDINQLRAAMGGSGTSTSCIIFGGKYGSPEAVTDLTESFDGTTWTEVADLATARQEATSAQSPTGTNETALFIGGTTGSITNATEEWSLPQNVKVITD